MMRSTGWLFSRLILRPRRRSRSGLRTTPAVENFGLSLDSDSEAYAGHLSKARERTRQAVDSAIRADSKETGAIWWENAALREAAFRCSGEAKQAAAEGLKLYPASQSVQVEAALAYAMAVTPRGRNPWQRT